jgi:hypothetical protein
VYLHHPVFRSNGSLRRCAKLPPVHLFGARGEAKRWVSEDDEASVMPLIVGQMKTYVAPDEKNA